MVHLEALSCLVKSRFLSLVSCLQWNMKRQLFQLFWFVVCFFVCFSPCKCNCRCSADGSHSSTAATPICLASKQHYITWRQVTGTSAVTVVIGTTVCFFFFFMIEVFHSDEFCCCCCFCVFWFCCLFVCFSSALELLFWGVTIYCLLFCFILLSGLQISVNQNSCFQLLQVSWLVQFRLFTLSKVRVVK